MTINENLDELYSTKKELEKNLQEINKTIKKQKELQKLKKYNKELEDIKQSIYNVNKKYLETHNLTMLFNSENKFGEVYTDEFICDLRNEFNVLQNIMSNEDIYNINDILFEIASNIASADKFEQLQLTTSPFFEYIEDGLSEGYYTKQ